ncbi:hypothetical protein [Microseira wollei]|uniref:Uncharacterized protein n=1 Tax=Microseira wollei NIES-4236 TaxID=2530354 RepID=A0AAV3XHV0_9CYAN|nr:hypothetical protein [Microseira wollei]GET41136.1 hypothetical protein MiSe_59480 [Microseira wollei NIES-4236]
MGNQVTSSKSSSSGTEPATVIDIDATSNNKTNPVTRFFTAGTYEVTAIGASQGGKYDAWSLWNFTTGCDEKGENCITGWVNEYNIAAREFSINVPSTGKYATAEQALANAEGTSFTLISDGQVNFFIGDDFLSDNRGGVSLAVKKIRQAEAFPQFTSASWVLLTIISLTVIVLWLVVSVVTANHAVG